MSRVTKFAARDPGAAARMAGFMAHLRQHGFKLGVGEAETALSALTHINAAHPDDARLALKTVCTGCAEDAAAFNTLFDSFWMNEGRVRTRVMPGITMQSRPNLRSSLESQGQSGSAGQTHSPDSGEGEAKADGSGRLIATTVSNLMKKDLRDVVSPQDIAQAEQLAARLGAALRDRRSRRRRAASKGTQIDFRRVIRRSLATGGEPITLPRRTRPDRPVNIVALCDVSGSMTVYARVFLAFLAGLMRADPNTDAYIFHTRLVRITQALRDADAMRALNRLTLLSDGFGGGSRIGAALDQFARSYARKSVNGRSVVLILSDGYDTDPASDLGAAMQRLKKRGCRIIWLNPMKSWRDYAPVAGAMAAALPYLDHFAAAGSLDDLAQLEPELTRL